MEKMLNRRTWRKHGGGEEEIIYSAQELHDSKTYLTFDMTTYRQITKEMLTEKREANIISIYSFPRFYDSKTCRTDDLTRYRWITHHLHQAYRNESTRLGKQKERQYQSVQNAMQIEVSWESGVHFQ